MTCCTMRDGWVHSCGSVVWKKVLEKVGPLEGSRQGRCGRVSWSGSHASGIVCFQCTTLVIFACNPLYCYVKEAWPVVICIFFPSIL